MHEKPPFSVVGQENPSDIPKQHMLSLLLFVASQRLEALWLKTLWTQDTEDKAVSDLKASSLRHVFTVLESTRQAG